MENFTPDEILEEINRKRDRFKNLRFISWAFLLVFFFLLADMFFLRILNLQNYGDFRTPVNVTLFFVYVWGNLYFIHDFLTDKMANTSNVPVMNKIGFLGWNVVCLGHLFGFINA